MLLGVVRLLFRSSDRLRGCDYPWDHYIGRKENERGECMETVIGGSLYDIYLSCFSIRASKET